MVIKVWTKKETQAALRALRAAGFPATKKPTGVYELRDANDAVAFRAIPGMRGYLVRHDDDLFRYAGEVPVANAR